MSRQSARKVKLTSKFEEFSTSRLASIQRHAHEQQQQPEAPVATPVTTPTPTPTVTPVATPAITPAAKPTPKPIATPVSKSLARSVVTPVATPIEAARNNMSPMPRLTANGKIRGRPRKCWLQKAETVVKPMSSTREELLRLREENITLKSQIDQVRAEHEELKRQSSYTGQTVPKVDYDDLKEKYQKDLVYAKRREWCVVCLNPSRYYCCWNTTYCSQKCQVTDWYQRHGKSCERRRALKTVS